MANGSELLTYIEQSGGAWRQVPFPSDTGNGMLKDPSFPSLAAQGSSGYRPSVPNIEAERLRGPGYAFISRLTEHREYDLKVAPDGKPQIVYFKNCLHELFTWKVSWRAGL